MMRGPAPPRRNPVVCACVALLAGAVVLVASGCGDDPPERVEIPCAATRDCPGGQFCACTGFCVTPNPCDFDHDCCANEICLEGLCLDRLACEADEGCAGGRVCRGCMCVPRTCESTDGCLDDHVCEVGLCLDATELPCRGLCGLGTVCSPLLDECVPTPASCSDVTCGQGETILIVGVEEHFGPTCELNPTCACSGARDVPLGDAGTEFSAVSLSGTHFAVVAYDHRYGDLVYQELVQNEVILGPVYVDGVPDEAPVGNPAGRRGGVLAAGPRRGAMPSATLLDLTLGAAYRDVDERVLRFARQQIGGTWEVSVVDGQADAGFDPDLVTLSGGRWAVAYFARGGGQSELRLAVSAGAEPSGPSDWTVTTIDSGPAETSTSEDIPLGVGLYPSVVVAGDVLTIAYYASSEGELRVAQGGSSGPFSLSPLDLGDTRSEIEGSADAGLYPALARSPSGMLAVAFLDRISGRVLYAELATEGGAIVVAAEPVELDPGRRESPPSLIGADINLVFAPTGRPFAVYQDASGADLWLAYRDLDQWQTTPVVRQGAAGFSPHLFLDVDVQAWVLHGILEETADGELVERLDARSLPDF